MLPLYSNDDDVVMSDDQYDESLDKDFEPDSESGESNDDHDDLDGYSSHGALLSSETSSRGAGSAHPSSLRSWARKVEVLR